MTIFNIYSTGLLAGTSVETITQELSGLVTQLTRVVTEINREQRLEVNRQNEKNGGDSRHYSDSDSKIDHHNEAIEFDNEFTNYV